MVNNDDIRNSLIDQQEAKIKDLEARLDLAIVSRDNYMRQARAAEQKVTDTGNACIELAAETCENWFMNEDRTHEIEKMVLQCNASTPHAIAWAVPKLLAERIRRLKICSKESSSKTEQK